MEQVQGFLERLEALGRQREEIWSAFARDYDQKAQAVSFLIDLAFSLSGEQVARMEQTKGIPAHDLTDEQNPLLSQAEPLMRGLNFLPQGKTLAESTFQISARGQMTFIWHEGTGHHSLGINWLPYSQCDPQRQESFAQAQQQWRDRREWLVCQHYADFRQAADSNRLVFLLALSLAPGQIQEMVAQQKLPVRALRPEQRLVLEATVRLYSDSLSGDLEGCLVQFEPEGQFWLIHEGATQTCRFGMGWLPYSWMR